MEDKIQFSDYLKMYQKHGIRLPVLYFFECHLFDLMHNIDTHRWDPNVNNLRSDYNFYMSSCTSIIKETFYKTVKYYPKDRQINFVDIGCGKGKVLCLWRMLANKHRINFKISGIEIDSRLASICKKNIDLLVSK